VKKETGDQLFRRRLGMRWGRTLAAIDQAKALLDGADGTLFDSEELRADLEKTKALLGGLSQRAWAAEAGEVWKSGPSAFALRKLASGDQFRRARAEVGLTMGEVARALKVPVSTVSDLEHDRPTELSVEGWVTLANILNHPPRHIPALAALLKRKP
jgi:DNA-binding transcriptional regulator YiaG